MAALFESLAVTGSRKADGSPNATGTVTFYNGASGTTLARLYGDADEESTLSNPVTLNGGGKATVYFTGRVRALIKDSTGLTLGTLTLGERAERIEVKNAGFTGTLDSGSLGAGGKTDLNTILTRLFASLGGLDGKYKEFTGATARSYQSVIRGIQVSVKDYGAVGNGVADDTIAIQAAVNECARLGGGVVWFDPGTYLISAVITVTTSGVSLRGCGAASVIKASNATQNAIRYASCNSFAVENLTIDHSGTSTGAMVSISACNSWTVSNVNINTANPGVFAYGVDVSGLSAITRVVGCYLSTSSSAIRYNATGGAATIHRVVGGYMQGTVGIEYDGTAGSASVVGTHFNATNAAKFNATLTGTVFAFVGCTGLSAAPFSIGLATDPFIIRAGNSVDGYVVSQASGGGGGSNHTPDRSIGSEIHVRLTSGGAAVCTLNAPTPAPSASMRGFTLWLRLTAAAGGAITWTFGASYALIGGGTTIAGADGSTTLVPFNWDPQTSKWRQACAAAATTT